MSQFPHWIALQFLFGGVLADVEELFSASGYCFMPIKGAYLIRSGLASSIAKRQMRDIDILIPEQKFREVCDWFSTVRHVKEKENYWAFEKSFLYSRKLRPVNIEFHRLVNFPARFLLPNEDLFSRGIQVSSSCVFPDPVDVLLIHVCHQLAHVISGFKDQFYSEIVLYSRQHGFSWPAFWKRAKDTGVLGFIWIVMEKCSRQKKLAIDLPPPPSLYTRFLSRYNFFMGGKNRLLHRLLFEMPFVRNPWGLMMYKITHDSMIAKNRFSKRPVRIPDVVTGD